MGARGFFFKVSCFRVSWAWVCIKYWVRIGLSEFSWFGLSVGFVFCKKRL